MNLEEVQWFVVLAETDWAKIASEITPGAADHGRYDDLYRTWRELYPATADVVHGLAAAEPARED